MIDALNSFLAVAASGSFSQVAKTQAVAVSSVTRKIDWLEAEVGSRLFNRSSRRVMLTDAGEKFLPRARNILSELAEAKDALSELHADPRGVMNITAPATFGRIVVTPAVVSFLARYPLMEVDLHLSDDYVDFETRRVDVAVRIGALADSDLISTRLAPMRLVVCASPDYLARRGTPKMPEDLLQHDCLDAVACPPAARSWCFQGVNRNAQLPVRGTLRSDDKDCLREAALAGAGIAHIASWLVSEDIAAGRLVALLPGFGPPPHKGVERAIHAVRMQGRSHEAKAKLFIAHLREQFGEVPYWDRVLDAHAAPRRARSTRAPRR